MLGHFGEGIFRSHSNLQENLVKAVVLIPFNPNKLYYLDSFANGLAFHSGSVPVADSISPIYFFPAFDQIVIFGNGEMGVIVQVVNLAAEPLTIFGLPYGGGIAGGFVIIRSHPKGLFCPCYRA